MIKEKKESFIWSKVIVLSIAHFIHDIFSCFLAPILPLLVDKLGISYSMAGFLSVVQRLPTLFSPIIGFFADRYKVRYILVFAPLVTCTSMSLLGSAPNLTVLILLLTVMGVGSAFFHVPAPVAIRTVSGDRIGQGMSFYMLGGELARSVGPIVILSAVSWWGLEGSYRLILVGLIFSAYLFFSLKDISVSKEVKSKELSEKKAIIKKKNLYVLGIIAMFLLSRGFLKAAVTVFLPLYLTNKGVSLWIAGLAYSLIQISGAVGTLCVGIISDYAGKLRTLVVLSVLTPIFMYIFVFAKGIYLVPVIIILGVLVFASSPVLLAIINNMKTDRPSFINGIYLTINFMIAGLTSFGVGYCADKFGIQNIYMIVAIVAVFSIPIILVLYRVNME
jgi:MFS transporter, FSR family, fosmidomycin resistance protein